MPILKWLTRDKDIRETENTPYRLLEEAIELSTGAINSENMLIQGDNLGALKSLLPYYAGQIKCIYIDPPYNTKSAFEHYDDNLEHSKWLAMMWPRLELLRELLAEDGSVWISIDDRECHYLKVIMDELFGRDSFVTSFIWQKVDSPNDNKVAITPNHEYVLCYAKNYAQVSFKQKNDESILKAYTQIDERTGKRCRDRLIKKNGKSSLRSDRPSMWFPLEAPDGTKVYPMHDDGKEARWAFSRAGIKQLQEEQRLVWKEREKNGQLVWIPYSREFAPDFPSRPNETILLDVKTSRQAKSHQRRLLPDINPFDTVKPEQLIERILNIATDAGDIVLDSFLGSGTTAAVAHKMGRRYIGIEMGDHAITHCVPRLKKVIEGEQGGISESQNWKGGGGFRFYRLGPPVFTDDGQIQPDIRFPVLAAHIWFAETGQPWHQPDDLSPFLGGCEGKGYALLYNGILGDKSVSGGNVLTRKTLSIIRRAQGDFKGPLVVYGERTALSETTLKLEQIEFKQTPYDVKARK
ncbi:MAG: site-specific DNA-methyltransferase [Idiomarina sp.]|nr:MAG: site-specific DNA-methyltransferase [Idiomarina sp.]